MCPHRILVIIYFKCEEHQMLVKLELGVKYSHNLRFPGESQLTIQTYQ